MPTEEEPADLAVMPQEIEYKFAVPDAATFEQLRTLTEIGPFALEDAGLRQDDDVYLDTLEYAILRAGYVCRLRRRDDTWQATIKGLHNQRGDGDSGLHQRTEVEVMLPGPAEPHDWPAGPARDLALTLAGDDPLVEVVHLRQRRHIRAAWLAGHPVAEVSMDETELDGAEQSLWMLELELVPTGTETELQQLSEALRTPFPMLQPENRSKLELALGHNGLVVAKLLDPTPEPAAAPETGKLPKSPGVRGDDRMSEAGRKVLRFHFRRMLRCEKGTRTGEDIEQLHDMRVATRRMRAAMRIFEASYDEDTVKPIVRGLRRTGRALGQVRDLDVLLNKLRNYTKKLPADERAGLEGLYAAWEVQREAARRAMLAHLDSKRYSEFKKTFDVFVETPDLGALAFKRNVPVRILASHVVPSAVWQTYEAIRSYEWVMERAPMAVLHQLRIEVKGLRYLLEFFREALGPEAELAIATLTTVQDTLGDLHDADVALHLLSEYLQDTTGLPLLRARTQPNVAGVVRYLEHQEYQLQRLQRRVPALWKQLNHPKLRRQLGLCVARL